VFVAGKSIAFFDLSLSDLSSAKPIRMNELPATTDRHLSIVPTKIDATFNRIEIGYKENSNIREGSIIGATTILKSKSSCLNGIELFLNTAPGASKYASKYKSEIKRKLDKYGLEYFLLVNGNLITQDTITGHDSRFIQYNLD